MFSFMNKNLLTFELSNKTEKELNAHKQKMKGKCTNILYPCCCLFFLAFLHKRFKRICLKDRSNKEYQRSYKAKHSRN